MTKEEKEKSFTTCDLKKNDKFINYLMVHGSDDIDVVKEGDKDI